MQRFEVWEYYCTGKNAVGQWYALLRRHSSNYILEIDDDVELGPRNIVRPLKAAGVLSTADLKKLLVTVGTGIIEIKDRKTNEPMIRLVQTHLQ